MKKNQYVVKHGNKWAVKGEGNMRATKVVHTQAEAISIARDVTKNKHSEMRVQDQKVSSM
ncbi:MAG: DUF2188 domain-containing protein [Lachnospiraceae bacterium]|nr:DUF2188 domain-containing protein [Lachnospiraceae bacterium]